ncbi:MAG TPA: tRNA uridine-5-carboxymethylaminomethyl(34) synthesis GTPase MnmE [Pseudolabrys sp.]|nr:tRNA uridine-5-carboxymethylaminomethyl(34) synthesis GTPase MnmE [Pseudolabrys sp.]
MPVATRNTIFALSSGRPPAAIAVVRISGPHAGDALKELTGKIPAPRKAALARVRGRNAEIIDQALVLWFPGPHSETGEDVAELQLHGGRAVVAAVFDALSTFEGLRPAEAGEFTRRAFENGKFDLTAAEGLADLVMAETEGQRRQAFRQMTGALRHRAEEWRSQLIQALALIEARIDFSDEADVPQDLVTPALKIARALEGEIASALADGARGERLREGLVVAIAGPPNAGKSTLLNRIAKREAAIVSPHAGTTRDVIEVHLDLAGLPVTLLDTAGIRETGDPIELEGVRRAQARAGAADLVLWVVEASDPAGDCSGASRQPVAAHLPAADPVDALGRNFTVQRPSAEDRPQPTMHQTGPTIWLIRNKIDLRERANRRSEYLPQNNRKTESTMRTNSSLKNSVNTPLNKRTEFEFNASELEFDVSALSGLGVDDLIAGLQHHAEKFLTGAESALITRERHRRALADTLAALRRALARDLAAKEDLLAEELRIAATALGRLTGRVDVEDILDAIFRDFCIGK